VRAFSGIAVVITVLGSRLAWPLLALISLEDAVIQSIDLVQLSVIG